MLLTALIATLSLPSPATQQLKGEVTLSNFGASAKVLLPLLGNQVDQQFVAGTDIADDVLALRLTKVPISEVMDRLAKIEFAEWKHDKEKWVLSRTQALERKREASELDAKTAVMKEALDKAAKQFAATPPLNEERARAYVKELDELYKRAKENVGFDVSGVQSRAPSRRAVIGLISKFDPRELASMRGERIVYSTRPTVMQRPMPDGALEVLQNFALEYEFFAKMAKEVRNGETPNLRIGGVDEPLLSGASGLQVDKALLVLRSTGFPDGINCSLQLYSADGKQIAAGTLYGLDPAPKSAKSVEVPPDDVKITLSPLAAEMARLSSEQPFGQGSSMQTSASKDGKSATVRFTGGKRRPPVAYSEALKAAVAAPDKTEPLGLAPGEALEHTAEAKNANLIALLPDQSFAVYNTMFGKQPSVAATRVLHDPAVSDRMIVTSETGWITIRPKYPLYDEQYRVPRAALAKLDSAVMKNGFCTLTDLLAFASLQSKPLFNFGAQIDSLYTRIASGGFGVISGNTDWDALRFVASLSSEQSSRLRNGSKVNLSSLGSNQMQLLTKLVYGSLDGPSITLKSSSFGDEINTYGYGGHIAYERTEAMAGGIPGDGYLTLQSSVTPSVFASNKKNGGGEMLDVRALATYKLQGGMPNVIQSVGMPPDFDTYLPAEKAKYDFTIIYSPGASQAIHLEDFRPTQGAAAGPYSALPAEFRTKVEEDYKFLLEMFKN